MLKRVSNCDQISTYFSIRENNYVCGGGGVCQTNLIHSEVMPGHKLLIAAYLHGPVSYAQFVVRFVNDFHLQSAFSVNLKRERSHVLFVSLNSKLKVIFSNGFRVSFTYKKMGHQ